MTEPSGPYSELCADIPSGPGDWRHELRIARGADIRNSCGDVSAMLDELDAFLNSVPGLEREEAANLRLVCDELVSNAIRHVSRDQDAVVRLHIAVDDGRVRLCYCDNGTPFDPFSQEEPYVGGDLERREIGGLGLFLIGRIFPGAVYERRDGWNHAWVECVRKQGQPL